MRVENGKVIGSVRGVLPDSHPETVLKIDLKELTPEVKAWLKSSGIDISTWQNFSPEEKEQYLQGIRDNILKQLNTKLPDNNQLAQDGSEVVSTANSSQNSVESATDKKAFMPAIDVLSADWQNKTMQEKIDTFTTVFSMHKAGEDWDKMTPEQQEQYKAERFEEFTSKLPGYNKTGEKDQQKYLERLVYNAELLLESKMSPEEFFSLPKEKQAELVQNSTVVNPEFKKTLQDRYALDQNAAEFSGKTTEEFNRLSGKEKAQLKFNYIKSKKERNEKLTESERNFHGYYKFISRTTGNFEASEIDLSKSADSYVYKDDVFVALVKDKNLESGTAEYNRAYADSIQRQLEGLSPEEAKEKYREMFANMPEERFYAVRGALKYLRQDSRKAIEENVPSMTGNQVLIYANGAYGDSDNVDEVNSFLSNIGDSEEAVVLYKNNGHVFENNDINTAVNLYAVNSNNDKLIEAGAIGLNTCDEDVIADTYNKVSASEIATPESKSKYAAYSIKFAENDASREARQDQIYNTNNIDMIDGSISAIKYFETSESRDKADEKAFNWIENCDNEDYRRRLTETRFNMISELNPDEQLSKFDRTMNSMHQDVKECGASNVDKLDPSVQNEAMESAYSTGDEEVVNAAMESLSNSKSIDAIEQELPRAVINAVEKDDLTRLYNDFDAVDDGLSSLRQRVASGAKLSAQEYASLSPQEKREYFASYFKKLPLEQKIKMLTSIPNGTQKRSIYKMLAQSNDNLFNILISDANIAKDIRDMNISEAINNKIDNIILQKRASEIQFANLANDYELAEDNSNTNNQTEKYFASVNSGNFDTKEIYKKDKRGNILV